MQVLPLRIFSMKVTQAVRYVTDQKGSEEGLKLVRHFFDNYKTWSEETISKTSLSTLLDNLAKDASTQTGLAYDDLRREVNHGSTSDGGTRRWLKYAMGTLHAGSAPYIYHDIEHFW